MNVALSASAATVIVGGTTTWESLLERVNVNPPRGAPAVNLTVHVAVPGPVIDPLAHVNEFGAGGIRLIPAVCEPLLLAMVSIAVCGWDIAAAVTANVALELPPSTVTVVGTTTWELLLDRVKVRPPRGGPAVNVTVQKSVPAPVIDPLPQDSELGAGGIKLIVKVCAPLVSEAVRMAVCGCDIAATAAANVALEAPAAILTLEGTTTCELLLNRVNVNPPVGASAPRVTPQSSVPAPVIDSFGHVSELTEGLGPEV